MGQQTLVEGLKPNCVPFAVPQLSPGTQSPSDVQVRGEQWPQVADAAPQSAATRVPSVHFACAQTFVPCAKSNDGPPPIQHFKSGAHCASLVHPGSFSPQRPHSDVSDPHAELGLTVQIDSGQQTFVPGDLPKRGPLPTPHTWPEGQLASVVHSIEPGAQVPQAEPMLPQLAARKAGSSQAAVQQVR
jgi:hypothetical protein